MKEKITSIRNFRDLGGIQVMDPLTQEKKQIKPHLLLRGEHMMNLTDADAARLINDYHVKYVVDLRTAQEQIDKPNRKLPELTYMEIPILTEAMAGITREKGSEPKAVLESCHNEAELLAAIPDLIPLYPMMVQESSCKEQLSKVIHFILEKTTAGEGVFFHCTGGKDRTGITAAILLTILGASRTTIYQDYLKTNRANVKNVAKTYYYGTVMQHSRRVGKKLAICYLAHPDFLRSAFDAMENQAASVESYITYILGITREEQDDFRRAVLE